MYQDWAFGSGEAPPFLSDLGSSKGAVAAHLIPAASCGRI